MTAPRDATEVHGDVCWALSQTRAAATGQTPPESPWHRPSARFAPRAEKYPPSLSPWPTLGAAVALLAMALTTLVGCAGGGPPPWPPAWPEAFQRQALFSCRMHELPACWEYVNGYAHAPR